MKYKTEFWEISKLYKKRRDIQFPEYQREPNVWPESKRELLIDSIIHGIFIPPLFLYDQGKGVYDCVDGQQRIRSLIEFLDGTLKFEGQSIEEIESSSPTLYDKISSYKLTIVIITDASEDDLRNLFIRLQLGVPLNAGEKLNAATGEMKEFVFKTAKSHPFFQNINIPSRRFAKEQVCAQICINSFSLALKGDYESARFEKLLAFFEQYSKLKKYHAEIERVKNTLDCLNSSFGDRAENLTNRALVLTAYLFMEELFLGPDKKDGKLFAKFYLEFIDIMRKQAKKGLDYDRPYRKIVDFYRYVTQAAFEPYSIKRRHTVVCEYFKDYKSRGRIKEDSARIVD